MEQMDVLVETAYTTYVTAMRGMDLEHRPLPPYADLPVSQQQAWRQALLAAIPMAATPAPEAPAPELAPVAEEPPPVPPVHITETAPPSASVPPHDADAEEPHRSRGGRK